MKLGLRDNLKNKILEKEKADSIRAEEAKREHAALTAQLLETAKQSFCRLLSEENVQKIVETHIEKIGGFKVVAIGCYHDKAVIYRDPGSPVPKQYPLDDIDFKMNPSVAMEVLKSADMQQAIEALKKEGIIVKTEYDVKSGIVHVSIDYRNI